MAENSFVAEVTGPVKEREMKHATKTQNFQCVYIGAKN